MPFASIQGTAEWFYDKFPGFPNRKCYEILEKCYKDPQLWEDVHALTDIVTDVITDVERDILGVEESKISPPPNSPTNKKRKIEDVLHAQSIEAVEQVVPGIGRTGLRNDESTHVQPEPNADDPVGDVRSDRDREDVLAPTPAEPIEDVSV
jgi:hypothetical protein